MFSVTSTPFCSILSSSSQSSRALRGLHSFPTRRSSDLFPRDRWLVSRDPPDQQRSLIRLRRDLDSGHLDRKSTRLNSSHVAISYAVFCLKKKKPHREEKHDAVL